MVVSSLQKLAGSAQEEQNFYDKVSSDMIAKANEGSITKTSLNKFRLHQGEYEWYYDGGIIRNDGPTMLYFLFKSTNPDTRMDVSNLKDESEKSTLDKFGCNIYKIFFMICP